MILRSLRLVWSSSRRWSALTAVLVLAGAGSPLLVLYAVGNLVDVALPCFTGANGNVADALRPLLPWLALFAAATLASFLLSDLQAYASRQLAERLTANVQSLIQQQLAGLDYQLLQAPSFQSATFRAVTNSTAWPQSIFLSALTLVQAAMTFLALAALLAQVAWWLPLTVVAAGIPQIVARTLAARRAHHLYDQQTEDDRRLGYFHRILTSLDFAAELRLMRLMPHIRQLYERLRSRTASERLHEVRHATTLALVADALTTLLVCLVFLLLIALTAAAQLSVGHFAMNLLAVRRAQTAANACAYALTALNRQALYVGELFRLLDLPLRHPTESFPTDWRQITVDNVHYRYPDSEREALAGVSFEVHRGEVVALTGANGAGKSTIVKLLLGLLEPTAGSVDIGGTPIRDIRREELARHVAALMQDFRLYCLTAADNVWLGNVEADANDLDRIRQAAQQAGIDDLLARLPAGYHTQLGNQFPGSEMFSRGEWQKLALARVLYSQADIVLLDEPGSSLDAGATEALLRAIAAWRRRGATVILVSHSERTTNAADRVVDLTPAPGR